MSLSLLAIDDQPEILGIVLRVAKELGIEAAATTDPREFKEIVRGGSPEVILLDLQIPGCDGVELLRFLFERQCTARIVLISGVDAKAVSVATQVGAGLGLRMAPPLAKPFRVPDLRERLAGFLPKRTDITPDLLKSALDLGEIEPFYQPVVDLGDGRLVGWEALARWRHPALGIIHPCRFIPLAEREDLMTALSRQVLERAIGAMAEWSRTSAAMADCRLTANITAGDLTDAQFPDWLDGICAKAGLPPSRLSLDIAEPTVMAWPERFLETMARLRVKGFSLAIDDFGTGASPLAQLYRLPFSDLKIDRSLITELPTSKEASVVVEAIVGLARAMGLDLVAEGVDGDHALEWLKRAGCEMAQGYRIARPMPAQDVRAWCDGNAGMAA